ncbi:MAG: PaaI family thioesterase [Deltaproteobacteria bacterium]|nr:PaaI family thioesterase [Deltaproteobacteria bacterium]
MKKLNPEHVKRIIQVINSSPYFLLLSMKVRDLGVGFSKVEIDLDKKHFHPFGFTHGGVFASIIDTAAFWAAYYGTEDEDSGMTSVDLKLNYLAPIASGRLIASGRQIKTGKTLAYAEAEVTEETGKILAHGTSTLMILPGNTTALNPPLPPKFLD